MKKGFRIIEGNARKEYEEDGKVIRSITYDGKHPLYCTANIQDAYDTFAALCRENYRAHMMLIADFGLMSWGQALRVNFHRANGYKAYMDDVEPYIELGVYHSETGKVDKIGGQSFILYTGMREVLIDDPKEAFEKFFRQHKRNSKAELHAELTWTDEETGKQYSKVRIVVSSDKINKQTKMRCCKKIHRTESWDVSDKKIVDEDEFRKALRARKQESTAMDELEDKYGTDDDLHIEEVPVPAAVNRGMNLAPLHRAIR